MRLRHHGDVSDLIAVFSPPSPAWIIPFYGKINLPVSDTAPQVGGQQNLWCREKEFGDLWVDMKQKLHLQSAMRSMPLDRMSKNTAWNGI